MREYELQIHRYRYARLCSCCGNKKNTKDTNVSRVRNIKIVKQRLTLFLDFGSTATNDCGRRDADADDDAGVAVNTTRIESTRLDPVRGWQPPVA